MKSDFVLGYELKGDYLVELLSDDNLALIDLENVRSSHSKPVTGATELLRDAWGNLYLATREKAFQLEPRGLTLPAARTPVDLNDLKWHIRYCDDASGNVTFIRRYRDVNQSLGFFAISGTKNQQAYLLKEISDKERKSAVQAFGYRTAALNQYLADRGLSKVTATTMAELALVNEALEQTYFFEGVYLTPSYSLIRLVNDSVYLFAHDIDSILVFDRGLNLVRSTFIDYHRLKVWDKEIIVNEERSKAYAKLKRDGQPMLAEIDLQTGTLKSPYFKMGMIFPQRIRIRKDVVYFMAKQQGGVGYSVYAQKLER